MVQIYFSSPDELGKKENINNFFDDYLGNENLADMLFWLNDDYDGSDCQMGAARLIFTMDRQLLQAKKELLNKAQTNLVYWKRPFPDMESLD